MSPVVGPYVCAYTDLGMVTTVFSCCCCFSPPPDGACRKPRCVALAMISGIRSIWIGPEARKFPPLMTLQKNEHFCKKKTLFRACPLKIYLFPAISTSSTVFSSPGSKRTAVPAAMFLKSSQMRIKINYNYVRPRLPTSVSCTSTLISFHVAPSTHQSHPVRRCSIELQVFVGFHEVIVTSDLDGAIAGARHVKPNRATTFVDCDWSRFTHDNFARRDVDTRVSAGIQRFRLNSLQKLHIFFGTNTFYIF